jgi:hypothetical protein
MLLLATARLGPAQQASIHAGIQQVYNFQPHLLSQPEMAQKSRVLDRFWTQAEEQPALYVAALRLFFSTTAACCC